MKITLIGGHQDLMGQLGQIEQFSNAETNCITEADFQSKPNHNSAHDDLLIIGPQCEFPIKIAQLAFAQRKKGQVKWIISTKEHYKRIGQEVLIAPFMSNVHVFELSPEFKENVAVEFVRLAQKMNYKKMVGSVKSSLITPSQEGFNQQVVLGHLLEKAAIGVLLLDSKYHITASNMFASHLLSIPVEELKGKSIDDLLVSDSSGNIRHVLDNIHSKPDAGPGLEVTYTSPSDDVCYFMVTCGALEPDGYILTFTDITEETNAKSQLEKFNNELEEEVQRRTLDLQRKNKELEQFAYITSHDLQEPLRTISSFIDVLKKNYGDHIDEDGKKSMRFIFEAADRMSLQIFGLLKLYRFGRQKTPVPVNIQKIVEDLGATLMAQVEDPPMKLEATDLPEIICYEDEVRELFFQLLTNAIKFRRRGQELTVSVTSSRKGDSWKFQVTDNGIGIEQRHQERIFTIFQRLHSRKDYEGIGIGLAYCKRIVELHGGQIWIEPAMGFGTVVNFTLSTNLTVGGSGH